MYFLKKLEENRSKGIFLVFVIWTLFTLSSSLLLFLRFKMTFSIIFLFQNNFASTHYLCAIIGKYITFPFVIQSTFRLLLFRSANGKQEKYTPTLTFIITKLSLPVLFLHCIDSNYHLGSFAFNQRTYFSISCKGGWVTLVKSFSVFVDLGMLLFCLHFWETAFLDIRILTVCFFPSSL